MGRKTKITFIVCMLNFNIKVIICTNFYTLNLSSQTATPALVSRVS